MREGKGEEPFRVFIVVEKSRGIGSERGWMRASRRAVRVWEFSGTACSGMSEEGLESLFPLSDVAVMGLTAVLGRLPTIVRRVHQVVDAALEARPDVLVIIGQPGFHPCGRQARSQAGTAHSDRRLCVSVRLGMAPGRARKMARYVDHLLGILPSSRPCTNASAAPVAAMWGIR